MDGDSGHLAVDDLALARVQTGTHRDAQLLHGVCNRARAADRARRPIEASKETVAGSVHFDAAIAKQFATDELVMLLEEIAPPAIAEPCRVFARGDDVSEEHGRENAIGLGIPVHCGVPRTFEERLDFAEIRLGLSDRRDIPFVVQLDVRRAGDLIRNEPSRVAGNLGILAVLQNQRRHANRREDVTDVD
jgi:hypothetical protein